MQTDKYGFSKQKEQYHNHRRLTTTTTTDPTSSATHRGKELHQATHHASSAELRPVVEATAVSPAAATAAVPDPGAATHKKPRIFRSAFAKRLPFTMGVPNDNSPTTDPGTRPSDPSNNPSSSTFPSSPPNAIPPRRSSTSHSSSSSTTAAAAAAAASVPTSLSAQATASVPTTSSKAPLRTVPETDWLNRAASVSSRTHKHSHSSSSHRRRPSGALTTTSFTVTMQPPPPPDPSRYATADLNFTRKAWPEEKDKVITGPFDYLFAHPGKDFRAQLIQAFNIFLDVPQSSLDVITNVVGMLHTASLLIDDVEDSSSLRRGLPVAHNIFGVAQTINSANYIYFCALQEVQKLKNSKAISIFAEELVHLHRGQGMDLFWRDTLTCPTEEDYLEMVGNKTGGLFRLGIKLMQAESRSLTDCVDLVNIMGLIFQIRDDYMNLSSQEYSDNKGMCEDLTEGKFSFPIIHSIRSDPSDLKLINILGQKTNDVEVKRYAVSRMESTGSFDYTKQVVGVLIDRGRKLADDIDEGRGLNKGIHMILDKMII
ncbi:polyprenyl synthetase [Colletotrichum kahawae]|uniref:Polyprenyl synthetase n=1 Tax=Colletotrichum kahawae TaxID=34407 RepID=A0AAE0D0A2_COLKA|nr:polyprenyl synthetase [Colletotrichum kahawae]